MALPTPQHPPVTPWDEARRTAECAAGPLPRRSVPLADACGAVLAADLAALTDSPPADVAAMDGWAVSGPGPWTLRGNAVLAGTPQPRRLGLGAAVPVATGAWLPPGATAVLRWERGTVDGSRLGGVARLPEGTDVRPRGQEAAAGEALLPAGRVVTPAVVGLAAAAGHDELLVVDVPGVDVLVVGDELLGSGRARDGRIRDSLGPMLPGLVAGYGGRCATVRCVPDDAGALAAVVAAATAPVVVTTGGTAAGPADHLHRVLSAAGGDLRVDGVAVRPGHPMLLARLPSGSWVVGLPGNPLAAVSGVLTLLAPLLGALAGREPRRRTAVLRGGVTGHPLDVRLVPVRDGTPSQHAGPAMLRGLAEADAVAVVPPGGAAAGDEVEVLALPW